MRRKVLNSLDSGKIVAATTPKERVNPARPRPFLGTCPSKPIPGGWWCIARRLDSPPWAHSGPHMHCHRMGTPVPDRTTAPLLPIFASSSRACVQPPRRLISRNVTAHGPPTIALLLQCVSLFISVKEPPALDLHCLCKYEPLNIVIHGLIHGTTSKFQWTCSRCP